MQIHIKSNKERNILLSLNVLVGLFDHRLLDGYLSHSLVILCLFETIKEAPCNFYWKENNHVLQFFWIALTLKSKVVHNYRNLTFKEQNSGPD